MHENRRPKKEEARKVEKKGISVGQVACKEGRSNLKKVVMKDECLRGELEGQEEVRVSGGVCIYDVRREIYRRGVSRVSLVKSGELRVMRACRSN